jgi:hypothetical protein
MTRELDRGICLLSEGQWAQFWASTMAMTWPYGDGRATIGRKVEELGNVTTGRLQATSRSRRVK